MQIPKTPATEQLRLRVHRAYTMAALAAWEGDTEAAVRHARMAVALSTWPSRVPLPNGDGEKPESPNFPRSHSHRI